MSDQSHVPSTSFVAIPSSTSLHEGKWTQDEHEAFLTGRTKYGNKWTKIATIIQTQTVIQIKRHAQICDKK
jgi:SHAQKYF class myb-like DNA-binding protein